MHETVYWKQWTLADVHLEPQLDGCICQMCSITYNPHTALKNDFVVTSFAESLIVSHMAELL